MESITNLNPKNRVDVSISDYDFLKAFKNEGERVYFRLVKEGTNTARNEDCILNLNPDEYPLMQMIFNKYQKQGFAVYFVVNSGGQKKNEITKVTAHFQDMDFGKVPKLDENGLVIKNEMNKTVYEYRSNEQIEQYKQEFIQRVKNLSLSPHIIIETKNGFHVYWLIEQQNEMDLLLFKPLQEALTNYFSQFEARKEHADRSVNNLPKVMRIPNYKHLKNPQDPFTIKCIYFSSHRKYTQDDIAKAIGIDLTGLKISTTTAKDSKKQSTGKKRLSATEQVKSPEKVCSQLGSTIDRLRSIDLRQFLGIDCNINENFKCIFHDDKSPSAVIGFKNGVYKYFCNSPNCEYHDEKGIDIIDIVRLQKKCNASDAIKYLIKYYNISTLDSEWESGQKDKIKNNIKSLDSIRNSEDTYKHLNQLLRYAYPYLLGIIDIGSKHIVNSNYNVSGQSLFFFSNRYLARKIRKRLDKTNWYINLFCVLGLLNKVDQNNIDNTLLQNAKNIAQQQSEYRICFYTIPDYSNVLSDAEERARLMLKYGFSIKGMCRKYVENVFGECFANNIYSIKIDCSLTNTMIQEYIESFMLRKIFNECGYFHKDMLLGKTIFIQGHRISRFSIEFEYRRCLPEIIEKYDLLLVHANKEVAVKYNINVRKVIIISNRQQTRQSI